MLLLQTQSLRCSAGCRWDMQHFAATLHGTVRHQSHVHTTICLPAFSVTSKLLLFMLHLQVSVAFGASCSF